LNGKVRGSIIQLKGYYFNSPFSPTLIIWGKKQNRLPTKTAFKLLPFIFLSSLIACQLFIPALVHLNDNKAGTFIGFRLTFSFML